MIKELERLPFYKVSRWDPLYLAMAAVAIIAFTIVLFLPSKTNPSNGKHESSSAQVSVMVVAFIIMIMLIFWISGRSIKRSGFRIHQINSVLDAHTRGNFQGRAALSLSPLGSYIIVLFFNNPNAGGQPLNNLPIPPPPALPQLPPGFESAGMGGGHGYPDQNGTLGMQPANGPMNPPGPVSGYPTP